MSERKICVEKQYRVDEENFIVEWHPLEPQPRCVDCGFLEEDLRCSSWGPTKGELYIRYPEEMYCLYWKVKE